MKTQSLNLLTLEKKSREQLKFEVHTFAEHTFNVTPSEYLDFLFDEKMLLTRVMHSIKTVRDEKTRELGGFFSFYVEKISPLEADVNEAPLLVLRFFFMLNHKYKSRNLTAYFVMECSCNFLWQKLTSPSLIKLNSYLYGEASVASYRLLSRITDQLYPSHHELSDSFIPIYQRLVSHYGHTFDPLAKKLLNLPMRPVLKNSEQKHHPIEETASDYKNIDYYYKLNPHAKHGYVLPTIYLVNFMTIANSISSFFFYQMKHYFINLFKPSYLGKNSFFYDNNASTNSSHPSIAPVTDSGMQQSHDQDSEHKL